MRWSGKMLHSRAGHRWKYDACALHAGWLRLQIYTQNISYLLLFHCNNCGIGAPQYCFLRTLPFFLNSKFLLCFQVTSTGDPLLSHTYPFRERVSTHTNTHTHTYKHTQFISVSISITHYSFTVTDVSQSVSSLYVSKPLLKYLSSLVHATLPAYSMFADVIT